MSSAFALALDTQAPVVWKGAPSIQDGVVRLDYSVNEPSLELAEVSPVGGGPLINCTVEPSRIIFEVEGSWAGGSMLIRTLDEVANTRDYIFDLPVVFSPDVRVRDMDFQSSIPLDEHSVKEPFTAADRKRQDPMLPERRMRS